MIYEVLNCTDTEVLEYRTYDAEYDGIQYTDCEPKQNEYGIFPFVVDGDTVRYKTADELATEAAEREQAEQIAQPTDADRLDAIEAAICDLAEMLFGGAE